MFLDLAGRSRVFKRVLVVIATVAFLGICLQIYGCATRKHHTPERVPPSASYSESDTTPPTQGSSSSTADSTEISNEEYDRLNPVHVVGRLHHRGKSVEWKTDHLILSDHRGGIITIYYPVDAWEETR